MASIGDWMQVALRHRMDRVLVVCGDPAGCVELRAADGPVGVVRTSVDPIEQQSAPFPMVYLDSGLAKATPEVRRAAIHQAVLHLDRVGILVLDGSLHPTFSESCRELGLCRDTDAAAGEMVVYRRNGRTTVHDLLWEARSTIRRVAAGELADELAGESAPLVVDTRTHTDRCRMGVIAGSIHVPRTVLEWHLDPSNGYRHPAVTGFDDRLVIVCNGGYSSSLAAANLVRLGFTDVRDLIGGVRAWMHLGHPTYPPDHAHLDL